MPKAAIELLRRAVAKEEGRLGIRANAVAPGIIAAGLGAQFLKDLYSPDAWDAQRRKVALRRFGRADEIAQAVAFLASDRASYITGQTLIVGTAASACRSQEKGAMAAPSLPIPAGPDYL